MLEFFDGRVCKQFDQYRDWDKEIKTEIGLHVLEAHGLAQGDGKASDPAWTMTRTLLDSVRHAGLHIQELDLRAAAMFLPGQTSIKAKTSTEIVGSNWTGEQKRYAKHFALSLKEGYPVFVAILATMVAMSGPFPGQFEKEAMHDIVKAIVSIIKPKG
jgi:hypothetical protein